MKIRLVRRVFDLDTFTVIPAIYEVKGPFTQVVGIDNDEEAGKIGVTLIQDPSIEETFKTAHDKWEKDKKVWDSHPEAYSRKGLLSCNPAYAEPVLKHQAKLIVMRAGEGTPLLENPLGRLTYLGSAVGQDGRVHLLTLGNAESVGFAADLFGSILGR